MADSLDFRFIFSDEGAPSGVSPGAVSRSRSEGVAAAAPVTAPQSQLAPTAVPRPAQPTAAPAAPAVPPAALASGIERALRATPLGRFMTHGDRFLKPVSELAQAVRAMNAQRTRLPPPSPASAGGVPSVLPRGTPLFGENGPPQLPTGTPAPNAFGPAGRPVNPRPVSPPLRPSVAPPGAVQTVVPEGAPASGAAVGGALTAIRGAALPIAGAAIAAGAVVTTFRLLNTRSKELSQSLSGYSGVLAAAQARIAVNNLRQDIRSANYLGKDLARFAEAQNRTNVAMQQIKDHFTKIFLEAVTPVLEWLATIVESEARREKREEAEKEVNQQIAAGLLGVAEKEGAIARILEINQDRADNAAGDFLGMFQQMPELSLDDPAGNHDGFPMRERNDIIFGADGKQQWVR